MFARLDYVCVVDEWTSKQSGRIASRGAALVPNQVLNGSHHLSSPQVEFCSDSLPRICE